MIRDLDTKNLLNFYRLSKPYYKFLGSSEYWATAAARGISRRGRERWVRDVPRESKPAAFRTGWWPAAARAAWGHKTLLGHAVSPARQCLYWGHCHCASKTRSHFCGEIHIDYIFICRLLVKDTPVHESCTATQSLKSYRAHHFEK